MSSGIQTTKLSQLLDLRGPDLVGALVKELETLHRDIGSLQRELEALRDFQASRDRWLIIDSATRSTLRLPRSVVIDANQSLDPRCGFYRVEYNQRGVPFCWTGPSQMFSFDVFVDRTSGAEIELRALSCIDFERQKKIQLLVDGESVETNVVKGSAGISVKAVLPAAGDSRATNLVFIVPEVLPPTNAADSRRLGLAFAWISVSSRGYDSEEIETPRSLEQSKASRLADPIPLVPRNRERRVLEASMQDIEIRTEEAATG